MGEGGHRLQMTMQCIILTETVEICHYPKSKHLFALDLYPMAYIVIFFSLYCHITYGLVN